MAARAPVTGVLELVQEAEAGFSGELAVACFDFRTGERFFYNAETPMRAASLIKLFLLVQALEQVSEGQLELSDRHPIGEEDWAGGMGVLKLMGAGLAPTLCDLLALMIAVSDNLATNKVIGLLGAESVNAFVTKQGWTATRLEGLLQAPPERQTLAQRRGAVNRTAAADVLNLLVGLERGTLLPPAETALARDLLKAQVFTEAMGRYLHRDPELNAPHVVLASKSGCLRGLWHDAGLLYHPDGTPLLALAILTDGSRDRSFGWEQEGMMTIARLAQRIGQYLGLGV